LKLRPGQNWAILGANGSGKTTLLHAIAGLRPIESGEILLDGTPISDWNPRDRARQLGILFQQHNQPFPATVIEIVLTGRHPWLGRWQDEGTVDHAIVRSALDTLALGDLAHRAYPTLSGGERRRVEVAALLAQSTPVNLLDEPVNHLDPRHQVLVLRQFSELAISRGALNLFVLHDVNLALRFCTHALMLQPGAYRAGRLMDTIDSASLEAVYGCPMREMTDRDQRWFVPD